MKPFRAVLLFFNLSFYVASLSALDAFPKLQDRDDVTSVLELKSGQSHLNNNLRHNRRDLQVELPMSEIIAQTFLLQLLEAYVGVGGVIDDIRVDGPIAMFMPWNLAFRNLPSALIAKLQNQAWVAHLQNLLRYHIYIGELSLDDLETNRTITMLNGEDVVLSLVEVDNVNRTRANDDALLITDFNATNGAAYMTDKVLRAAWLEKDLAGLASSVLPTLASYAVMAGLEDTLTNPSASLTIFAPNQAAFEKLDSATITYLESEAGLSLLTDILLYHISPDGPYPSTTFRARFLPTLQGERLQLLPSSTADRIIGIVNNATIVLPDQLANNGLVHVIDEVLLLGSIPTGTDGVDSGAGFVCNGTDVIGGPQFTFNRSPSNYTFPAFLPLDPDEPDSLCFLRLTDDEFGPAAVSAWLPINFDETNTGLEFSMSIGYRIYGEAEGSADGMAFLMHQDANGLEALGFDGGGIGYMDITRALVVEWDTFLNADLGDTGENNIHVRSVDAEGNFGELGQTDNVEIRTSETGSPGGRMWVEYCNGVLSVYLDNNYDLAEGGAKPSEPELTISTDLSAILEPTQQVYVGYTSGKFGQADYHDILFWEFEQFACES